MFHSICCCPRNASYGDSRFHQFIQSSTFYMFYNRITKYKCFFLWGILDLRFWLIFWFPLLLISCKLIILLPSVFGDSYNLFVVDLCFSSCTFSWCRFGGNTAELILAGTQWFSVSDLMMNVLFRFSFQRQLNSSLRDCMNWATWYAFLTLDVFNRFFYHIKLFNNERFQGFLLPHSNYKFAHLSYHLLWSLLVAH